MTRARDWCGTAVRTIETELNRSADTHLIRLEPKGAPGIFLYLKDESTHPTGSLKHRLARSLFLYALCNGWIGQIPRSSRRRAGRPPCPRPISRG